ncbi:MAG: helix-turn-helix transcriptional regulator [Alphaproteobacteria bacterium]
MTGTSFGALLRDWRDRRHMSQLDLGLTANVSARHISFLETGRARPSRAMVQMLGEVLDVPRTSRNALLHAAGFAPAYRSRDWSEGEMGPVRAALDWMLTRHDPYPAFALDRHWLLIRANRAAGALFGVLGLEEGGSLLDVLTDREVSEALFENWREVMHHLLARLRTESLHLGGDVVLDAAAETIATVLGSPSAVPTGALAAVIPTRLRAGGVTLSLFSTVAQFGTAEDIALADLKIEMLFPADESTREVLVGMGGGGDTRQGI